MVHSLSMQLSIFGFYEQHTIQFLQAVLIADRYKDYDFNEFVLMHKCKTLLFPFSHFFCFQPCQARCNVGTDLLQERKIDTSWNTVKMSHSCQLFTQPNFCPNELLLGCEMQECKNAYHLTTRNKEDLPESHFKVTFLKFSLRNP